MRNLNCVGSRARRCSTLWRFKQELVRTEALLEEHLCKIRIQLNEPGNFMDQTRRNALYNEYKEIMDDVRELKGPDVGKNSAKISGPPPKGPGGRGLGVLMFPSATRFPFVPSRLCSDNIRHLIKNLIQREGFRPNFLPCSYNPPNSQPIMYCLPSPPA